MIPYIFPKHSFFIVNESMNFSVPLEGIAYLLKDK